MNWSDQENDLAIDAYLEMLKAELDGRSFVKRQYIRSVTASTGRTRGSVEFKFANISAVLQDLGMPWVDGYKPRANYQTDLRRAVERRLAVDRDSLPRHSSAATGSSATVSEEVDKACAVGAIRAYSDGLRALPQRSFGGAGVAVRPDDWPPDSFWPTGSSSPAADEALDWIRTRIISGSKAVLGFLVGGPGNGKSFLTSNFVAGLEELSPKDDGLAHRTYRYRIGVADLVLVNDATIHRSDARPSPLVADIDEAVEGAHHLLANVNRGILYEELSRSDDISPGRMVVQWLEGSLPADSMGWRLEPIHDEQYFRSARLLAPSDRSTILVSVNMDVCSLFEHRPGTEFDPAAHGVEARIDGYRIERLNRRDEGFSDRTPGGSLIKAFVEGFPTPEVRQVLLDPFEANLESLAKPKVRTGVCTILRGAEIASSKRLTYRELWGAISLLVLGDLTDRYPSADPQDWLGMHQPQGSDVLQHLEATAALAGLRFHQALFRARPYAAGQAPTASSPVTRLTQLVDPVIDARPGKRLSSGAGWADPVLDAFAAQSLGESPLEGLRRSVDADDAVLDAITDIETSLDAAVMEALASGELADSQRRGLLSWYGEYLLRLYATANGLPAFSEELNVWTRLWQAAHRGDPIPEVADRALHTLLLPAHDPHGPARALVLPAFDARTVPVSESVDEPKLVLSLSPDWWALSCREDGDQLFVQLREMAEPVVELELDFPVLREAMACQAGYVGITEYANVASPRLERFRATLLNPLKTRHARVGIVAGSSVSSVEIGPD
jgi:hypothetical protein